MHFPHGYGSMKKVKAWMEEFHHLPYVSPYEDTSMINPDNDLLEKQVIGVLHKLLSFTVHKKTKRNKLHCLREELGLPHKFTRVFTRYPGIFYLSLKCKTTTVVLREGYEKGKLVESYPITRIRDKLHYVMRMRLLYRGKGMTRLVLKEDDLIGGGGDGVEKHMEEDANNDDDLDGDDDSGGDEDEYYELDTSDEESESNDD